MNPHPETHFANEEEKTFWIENVISDFQEGNASPDAVEKLRALMLHDPGARRIYQASNQLTLLLEEARIPIPQAHKKPRALLGRAAGIAAALAIGIWLIAGRNEPPASQAKENPRLATLSSSHEAQWSKPGATLETFQAGEINLLSGIAELEFRNGARFVIEGPCQLDLIDEDSLELISGKLWGYCPPSARGFEILTPGGNRIIDLGTEFGIGAGPSGSMDVHVFDGEVELFQENREKRALEAGAALQLAPGEDPFPINADFERFTDASELQRQRWQNHHDTMLSRDDLLLYYDFSSQKNTLINQASPEAQGDIIGAVAVNGRIPGKSALLFEKTGDAVAFDLDLSPQEKGFTIAMWIKPDVLDKSLATLLNSNGYKSGDIHFQMSNDGSLQIGICEITAFRSEPFAVYPASWQMVTATWDLETNKVALYHNGIRLTQKKRPTPKLKPGTVANFGSSQIGAWGNATLAHPRNFTGRIGEVMIFSSPLESPEIEELYRSSRP